MSEKKVVRRSVAIGLGIVCIILIVGIGGAMAYYTSINIDKDTTYKTYASTHSHTNSEFDSVNASYYDYMGNHSHTNSEFDTLQSDYNNYVASHHYADSEYSSLNASYYALTVASLTTVGLSVTNFNHYWVWDPPSHLTINGYIFNMGTDTAYNCKLHVKVWSSTDTLLLDTTVDLGSISGRSYIYKSTETPYTGSGSYWSVIPEWTTTP